MELKSSKKFSQTQAQVVLTNAVWATVDIGFTPTSVIIKNNSAGILYFREHSAVEADDIVPIDAGETWETSMKTRTTFQLNPVINHPAYKVIASIN